MLAISKWSDNDVTIERSSPNFGISSEASKHLLIAIRCIEDEDAIAIEHVKKAMQLLELTPQSDSESGDVPAARKSSSSGLVPWQVNRVTAHVIDHIADQITIDDLARLVNLSPSYFSAVFKITFGVSPHNYVLQQRIEYAKKQMLFSENSFSEIALACGLSDQAHLSRTFRRITGMTPSAWRRFILRKRDDAVRSIEGTHVDTNVSPYFNRFSGQSVNAM